MSQPERAGQPARPSDLVDIDALLAAYADVHPDPSDPAQRVAFGTSGHRGSALKAAFNEDHILATTEAICRYRASQGTPALCSSAATRTRCPSPPGARRSRCWPRTTSTFASTARIDTRPRRRYRTRSWSRTAPRRRDRRSRQSRLADGIVVTPSHNPPEDGGFKYNPPNGGPADTDVTRWIQDEANRILEASGRTAWPASSAFRSARARTGDGLRLHGHVRGRPRARRGHGRDRRLRPAAGRRSAGRRGGRLLGRDRRAVWARPHRDQRDRRSAVRVHDPRLGRPDPDGPILAVCDGAPRRAARPVRSRPGQRHGRGPPRDRRPGKRADEPQPRAGGGHLVPVRGWPHGRPMWPSARPSSRPRSSTGWWPISVAAWSRSRWGSSGSSTAWSTARSGSAARKARALRSSVWTGACGRPTRTASSRACSRPS